MASIVLRLTKGSPLTNAEVDANFSNLNTELALKEVASNKGVANGYASLDATGKVPSVQLPSFVDDVLEYANQAGFPATGETGKIYVALDTNKTYRWGGSSYTEISPSPGSTDSLSEGSVNLYFTQARARASISATQNLSYNASTGAITGPDLSGYLTINAAASGYQPLDADLTSIAGLAGTSGFLKKTAANTWALDTNTYLTGNQSISITGDATGSGTTSISLTLANSGVAAGTYTKVTVDSKGRVTSGTSLASADLPTYTGSLSSSQVTTALGYTPYNSTNPSGYITSSGSITGSAGSVAWSGVTGKPTTLAGYGITDAASSSHTHSYLSLSGGELSGRVISIVNGRTTSYAGSNFEVNTTDNTPPGISFHRGGYSATLLYENDGELYVNAWTTRAQNGKLLSSGNYNSYSPTLTGTGASGTWSINVTGSAGSVDWTNVSGRPTALSSFTNDSGYITSSGSITGSSRYVTFLDTRSTDDQPQGKAGFSLSADFKSNSVVGSPPVTASGLFSHILTIAGWDTNGGSGGWPSQVSIGDGIAVRQATSATAWGAWRTVLHSGNYTSYSPSLTGSGASGTWGINVTGNAATVTNGAYINVTNSFSQRQHFAAQSAVASHDVWSAAIEVREVGLVGNAQTGADYAPAINFHWSMIASTAIKMFSDASVRIISQGNSGSPVAYRDFYANNIFNAGNQVLHAGNYTSYSPSLTGSGASGTWNININGAAGAVAWSNVNSKPTTLAGYGITDAASSSHTHTSFSNLTINDGYTEETATASTGTAYTIDLANGSLQILTLTGNCTFTFPSPTSGKSFMLLLKQDATGSRTATWPAAVKWPGGTAPTITATASKADKFVFTADGSSWFGSVAGQNF